MSQFSVISSSVRSIEGNYIEDRYDVKEVGGGAGFRIQDSGFRIQDSGFRIQDSGFRIQDSGFRMQDSGGGVQS
jgi:uncharacterized protein YxjI